MKKSLYIAICCLLVTANAQAAVHTYKDADGNLLISNRAPKLNKADQDHPTSKDFVPSKASDDFAGYTYQSTSKPIVKKVHIPTKKVYESGLCKMGDVLVDCYTYKKTIPAHTMNQQSSKEVVLSPEQLQHEAEQSTP